MVSAFKVLLFAQFYYRPLKYSILSMWDKWVQCLDNLTHLSWWFRNPSLHLRKSFLICSWKIFTIDASLTGREESYALCQCREHGRWSSVNILELLAIWLFLQHWTACIRGHPIRIQLDNTTAVAYIDYHGGTRRENVFQSGQYSMFHLCPPFALAGKLLQPAPTGSGGMVSCKFQHLCHL